MTFVMSVFREKMLSGISLDMIKAKKKKEVGEGIFFFLNVTFIFGYYLRKLFRL